MHRAYTSSTFFYFYDSDGEEDGEGEESEDGESEDEERDDKFSKAQKKVKGAEIEKPECKQQ